ncbi:MAG: hypothetical protein JO249_23095 [Acidobacteria bacterium]|nr:hypothetical protein [Acidobacteriota bacterium]
MRSWGANPPQGARAGVTYQVGQAEELGQREPIYKAAEEIKDVYENAFHWE